MADPVEFKNEGYNCCEAILKAVNEDKKANIPVSMGTPFGSGMAIGSTCGAIAGAIMAVGAMKGRSSNNEPNNTRTGTRKILNNIIEKYGTLDCIELKRKGIPCSEIIEYAYSQLNQNI